MRFVCQDCRKRYKTEDETPPPDPACPKCGGPLLVVEEHSVKAPPKAERAPEQAPARSNAVPWIVGAVVTVIGVTFLLVFFGPKTNPRSDSEEPPASTTTIAKRPPKKTPKKARRKTPPKPVAPSHDEMFERSRARYKVRREAPAQQPPPSFYKRPADETYAPPGLLADDEPDIVAGGPLKSRRPLGNGNVQLAYRWEDPHSVRIVRWSGDTRIIDARSTRRELALTLAVDRNHMRRVAASFGLPNSWRRMLSAYSTTELERKERARERKLADRGVVLKDNRPSVDHKWVVEKSRGDMKALAQSLHGVARSQGYTTQRERLGIIASFVQSMAYKPTPGTRRAESGGSVTTGGITMPIETLYRGYGDCDTKSLLFASILANIPRQRLIFVMDKVDSIGEKHLFVGVRGIPRLNDHYVEISGTKYVLIEMTTAWPVGRVSQKSWLDYRRGVFKTVKIVDTTE